VKRLYLVFITIVCNRFITNIWAVKTDSWSCDLGKVPVLWLNDESDETLKSYRLVIYKAHQSILCMFIKSEYFFGLIYCLLRIYGCLPDNRIEIYFLTMAIGFSGLSTYGGLVQQFRPISWYQVTLVI